MSSSGHVTVTSNSAGPRAGGAQVTALDALGGSTPDLDTFATVFAALGIPGPEAFRLYTRHGPAGAEELASAGAEPLVVSFTRAHHGDRPESIEVSDWELLKTADHLT